MIRHKIRAAHDRHKSYDALKRSDIEFAVGNKVSLKVSPVRAVMHFGKRKKLNQKFIGPYEILERVGELRKYASDTSDVLLESETVVIDENLLYVEVPKEVLDKKVRKARNGETTQVKVL
ncbi:uncharacterized protein LOC141613475 [Silene latifolia]|uniref:uncharacterized protein LOC141613475 n=1 Tax=Silene latifolia TaxID=37657 RepID=UPI003D78050F